MSSSPRAGYIGDEFFFHCLAPAMIPFSELLLFAGAALLLVLTPGPNMIYLLSRSLCQGSRAGVISLFGVAAGFLVHMLAAAVGLTALFMAVPFAYEALKWAGAAYLLWLAWQAVRPGAVSPFQTRELPPDPPRKLFLMGFLTNVLNPKVAVFYLSLLPQFVDPGRGSVFAQSVVLGGVQIAISFSVNLVIAVSAAAIAAWFARNPLWLAAQRWIMGGVLAALAVRLALEERRP
jgi:threonine/homoserine/homoserine lactone efflux protein